MPITRRRFFVTANSATVTAFVCLGIITNSIAAPPKKKSRAPINPRDVPLETVLDSVLSAPEPASRRIAIDEIARRQQQKQVTKTQIKLAVPVIVKALDDISIDVRSAAVGAIEVFGADAKLAASKLIELGSSQDNAGLRRKIIPLLPQVAADSDDVVDFLMAAAKPEQSLANKNLHAQPLPDSIIAIYALARIGRKASKSVPLLTQLMESAAADPKLQGPRFTACCKALGAIGAEDVNAISLLEKYRSRQGFPSTVSTDLVDLHAVEADTALRYIRQSQKHAREPKTAAENANEGAIGDTLLSPSGTPWRIGDLLAYVQKKEIPVEHSVQSIRFYDWRGQWPVDINCGPSRRAILTRVVQLRRDAKKAKRKERVDARLANKEDRNDVGSQNDNKPDEAVAPTEAYWVFSGRAASIHDLKERARKAGAQAKTVQFWRQPDIEAATWTQAVRVTNFHGDEGAAEQYVREFSRLPIGQKLGCAAWNGFAFTGDSERVRQIEETLAEYEGFNRDSSRQPDEQAGISAVKHVLPANPRAPTAYPLDRLMFLDWRNATWRNDVRGGFEVKRVGEDYIIKCNFPDGEGYEHKLIVFRDEEPTKKKLIAEFRLDEGTVMFDFRPRDLSARGERVKAEFRPGDSHSVEMWVDGDGAAKAIVDGKPAEVHHDPTCHGYFAIGVSNRCTLWLSKLRFEETGN